MAIAEPILPAATTSPISTCRPLCLRYCHRRRLDGRVASEAASLAGHLRLGKLIYLYDDNRISIDGSTDLTFTEDRAANALKAYGWHVLQLRWQRRGSHRSAICQAKLDPRPSLIICRTHIGFGLPTRQDTAKAHGEPPGDEELNGAKTKLGWPLEPRFLIPEDVLAHFREIKTNGERLEGDWKNLFKRDQKAHPQLASEFKRVMAGELPAGWDAGPAPNSQLTRRASPPAWLLERHLNALAVRLPELMGGSADLTPSNNTALNGVEDFNRDSTCRRYLHFACANTAWLPLSTGMAYHTGHHSFLAATFMVFTDYMRLPFAFLCAFASANHLGDDAQTASGLEKMAPPITGGTPASLRAIPN